MRLEFLLFSIGFVSAGFLQDQSSEEIDPVKQVDNHSEDNDQSKRTLFDDGNRYALERHIKYHPSGYKYLLGYRPVKLQLVPMARPLYTRPMMRPMMQLRPVHIGNKPVVSLVPPKLNPIYKPGGYVYNKPLPVNVPPTIPTKPWQHQGWDMFKLDHDKRPFIPSSPFPEPDTNVADHNYIPPTGPSGQPGLFPSIDVQSRPTFDVQPVHPVLPTNIPAHHLVPLHPAIPIQPAVPIPPPPPTVHLQPALPLPPPVQPAIHFPVQPTVHVQHAFPVQPTVPVQPIPVHPPATLQPNFNTVLHHSSLLPIQFLPGKFNIPVPNLGVLPLGSSVPVQLSSQNHQIIHKTPILSGPINLNPQQTTHIIQKTPIFSFGTSAVALTPEDLHKTPVVEPPVVQKFVPELNHQLMPGPQIYFGGPQILNKIPDSSLESGFTPAENPPQHQGHISVNPHQLMPDSISQIPMQQHNYQYFVQHLPPNNAQQYQDFEQQGQEEIHQEQQQGYEDSPGFFQGGQTDLQIPDYLPEHPHFKHLQQYQDNS